MTILFITFLNSDLLSPMFSLHIILDDLCADRNRSHGQKQIPIPIMGLLPSFVMSCRFIQFTLFISVLLLLFFIPATYAMNINLSTDVLSFVPECAQSCFTIFIDLDYGVGACGVTPSLQCLCSKTGARGFTVGEMAVQCIFGEDTVGGCEQGEVNSKEVLSFLS